MAAPSDRLRCRSGVVADAAAANAAAPGRAIHVLRNGVGEGGADRHGAGVGPASTLARPRPWLPGAPFGMDTRRSAPGPAAAPSGGEQGTQVYLGLAAAPTSMPH